MQVPVVSLQIPCFEHIPSSGQVIFVVVMDGSVMVLVVVVPLVGMALAVVGTVDNKNELGGLMDGDGCVSCNFDSCCVCSIGCDG